MIYLIARCSGGYDGTFFVAEVLEGPEGVPVDKLWEEYEGSHDRKVGHRPQDYQSPLYQDLVKAYELGVRADLTARAERYGVRLEGDQGYHLSQCFVGMLLGEYGLTRTPYELTVNAA